MAIVRSMNNRNLIGQMGGAVFYMNKGQNISRELAPSVSNPRTDAQQTQRLKLANLVAFYRANRPWMFKGAFETKPETWSDYNAFVSANNAVSPVYLTKQQAEQGAAVVAPYIVTRGTLPTISLEYHDSEGEFMTDLYLGAEGDITENSTIGDLSAKLIANNNGLREGDQISIIQEFQTSDANAPYITCRYFEIILNSRDAQTLAERGISNLIAYTRLDPQTTALTIMMAEAGGCAVILSRTVSGKTRVSSQSVVMNTAGEAFLRLFTSNAAIANAIASYGQGEDYFLAAGYQANGVSSSVFIPISILSVGGVSANDMLELESRVSTLIAVIEPRLEQGETFTAIVRGRQFNSTTRQWGDFTYQQADTAADADGNAQFNIVLDEGCNTGLVQSVQITTGNQVATINFSIAQGEGDPGDVTP